MAIIRELSISVKRTVTPGIGIGFSAVDGTLNERHVHYYEARAKGRRGLLIVEVGTANMI